MLSLAVAVVGSKGSSRVSTAEREPKGKEPEEEEAPSLISISFMRRYGWKKDPGERETRNQGTKVR